MLSIVVELSKLVSVYAFCPSKQITVLEAKRRIGIETRSGVVNLVVAMVL